MRTVLEPKVSTACRGVDQRDPEYEQRFRDRL